MCTVKPSQDSPRPPRPLIRTLNRQPRCPHPIPDQCPVQSVPHSLIPVRMPAGTGPSHYVQGNPSLTPWASHITGRECLERVDVLATSQAIQHNKATVF